ncbi:pre-mRNA-splicing factor CWC22 homolog isoform X2 [Linepithema humile]|uniref:pre-mRNA-splicing factor CWC22 homolog isoform X2 n=1 Tax=Linepithema humile TaxID=83485 RepID=UPI00351EDE70
MKMRPAVNSDESVTANRSVHIAQYTDHLSRRPKEQISGWKNAQTEYETHLSQNAARSSTYGSDWHNANREWRVNYTTKDEGSVPKNPEKTEQNHKGVDTRDHSPHRYQSKSCAILRLWCVSLCRRKKKYSKRVLGKPTRRFLEHIIKKRSRECGNRDEAAVAGVSTASHRESISPRSGSEKSKRSRKQDETVEVADKEDISVDVRKERKDRKKRKAREEEERERKERERRERREKKERSERRKQEEEILHLTDAQVSTRDEDIVVEDHIPRKPPPTDFTKNCCYLCAENTLAIAAATSKPEQSDKCVQVSAHKLHTETFPMLDKSCSPLLLVRTVQSSVKVRTRETSTLCPDASVALRKETRTKKRKKFSVFPRLTRTKCPAGRNAACETDKLAARRDDNSEKRELRIEKCCREKKNT